MILTLLLLPVLAVTANPFHKYPYVFLLDVGNEELEKVNTEQIRLSSPGGSVALRYPAIGYGDDIAHVRVSGIDFGTDLKANILDGGPGYKYVVFVLMGNPGVAYDAVITIQTVPTVNDDSIQTIDDSPIDNNENPDVNANEVPEEQNISAEELNDKESASSQITNDKVSEQTQESANVYSYAPNEALSGYGDDDEDDDENNNDNDVNQTDDDNVSQNEQHAKSYEQNSDVIENEEVEDYGMRDEDLQENQQWPEKNNVDNSQPVYQKQLMEVNQNVYNKLKLLNDLYNRPQGFQPDPRYQSYQDNAVDEEEAYNDYEELESDMYRRFRANNKVVSDDTSAIAY